MDLFGYPFARGRIFDEVEKDHGQYDNLQNRVFWTSGCALLLRKSVTDQIGLLDDDFFAHQEEIDLNWRAQLAGYKNRVVTSTYIYHYSGYTLRSDNQRKMYLNHRNNLIMMIKNYSLLSLIVLLPARIMLELITVVADFILWEGKRARAVIKALIYIGTHAGEVIAKHRKIQKTRTVSDWEIFANMYKGSVVFDHFVAKKKPQDCINKFRN